MDAKHLDKSWPEIIEWFPKDVLSLDKVLEKLLVASKPSPENGEESEVQRFLEVGVFRVVGGRVVLIEAVFENGRIVKNEITDHTHMDAGFIALREKINDFV